MELKEVTGNLESLLIFFLFNRNSLLNLKEVDIDVTELTNHATAEDVDIKQLLISLIPCIELLNNEVVTDKMKNDS